MNRDYCPECGVPRKYNRHADNCKLDHKRFRRPVDKMPSFAEVFGEHNRLPPENPELIDDSPVYVAVDPAAGPDHSELVFVDKTDGKNLSPGAAVKIGKIEALRIQSPPQLFSTINQNVPVNICFYDGSEEVGEFLYDKGNKRWTFKGNMDEAAKLFAKFMYSHFQSLIEGDRDHLLDDAITDMYGGKDEDLERKYDCDNWVEPN